jgi:hypothetical protein
LEKSDFSSLGVPAEMSEIEFRKKHLFR